MQGRLLEYFMCSSSRKTSACTFMRNSCVLMLYAASCGAFSQLPGVARVRSPCSISRSPSIIEQWTCPAHLLSPCLHGRRSHVFSDSLLRCPRVGSPHVTHGRLPVSLSMGQSPIHAADLPPELPKLPSTPLLMLITGLQVSCFGVIGTALPPALSASGMQPAAVALLLGQLGSAAAFFEVLLSGGFGKLADAIGRKPILVAAPILSVLARLYVVFDPSLNVLIVARLISMLSVPIYWLAYAASIADLYSHDTTQLAVVNSRLQAAMGLGFAVSSVVGGWLAAKDIRLAYGASCVLGTIVLLLHAFLMKETLPAKARVPFKWSGSSPLSFIQLFKRGPLFAKFNMVVLFQSITNGMGDLWQVLARELRGWGAAQCGSFAALAGVATMLGTLLTGPSIRRLGARGHTLASTSASAVTSLVLGHATTNVIAWAAVFPLALGAGKHMATSARIVNLGQELGVPQGQLSAERNTLNAIIKVVAPTIYAWLFAWGASHSMLALPFYTTAVLLACSALMAATIPANLWQSTTSNSAEHAPAVNTTIPAAVSPARLS